MNLRQGDDELVSPEPADGIGAPNALLESPGHRLQQQAMQKSDLCITKPAVRPSSRDAGITIE